MNRPRRKANIRKLLNNKSSSDDAESEIDVNDLIKTNQCQSQIEFKSSAFVKETAAEVKARTRLQPRRTKLDNFVYSKKTTPPTHNNDNHNNSLNDESDFETPAKKCVPQSAPVAKAPKPRKRKTEKQNKRREKSQPNIKSALMRNEMLFSDIVAQHTIADNFNPHEIQLALALSKSEQEQNRHNDDDEEEEENNEAKKDKVKDIRKQLERYGFRTAPHAVDYANMAMGFGVGENFKRPRKCKWIDKITPLTLRNAELQAKKLQLKIGRCVKENPTTTCETLEQAVYRPISCLIGELLEASEPAIMRKHAATEHELEQYFVLKLFEISRIRAGYLLKDWSKIQGREMSPKSKALRRCILPEEKPSIETDAMAVVDNQQSSELDLVDINKDDNKFTCTRSNSPDIFGNSLCESADASIVSDGEGITETGISTVPSEMMADVPIVNLMQCEDDEESKKNQTIQLEEENEEVESLTSPINKRVRLNSSLKSNTPSPAKTEAEAETSIDLTQSCSDSNKSDSDDDVILLSDDEINYSTIKSKSFKAKGESSDIDDNDSVKSLNKSHHNYSLLDLLADFRQCENDQEENNKEEGVFRSPEHKRLKLNPSSSRKTLNTSCDSFQKPASFDGSRSSYRRKCNSMVELKDGNSTLESINLTKSVNGSMEISGSKSTVSEHREDTDNEDVILLSDDEINYSTVMSKSYHTKQGYLNNDDEFDDLVQEVKIQDEQKKSSVAVESLEEAFAVSDEEAQHENSSIGIESLEEALAVSVEEAQHENSSIGIESLEEALAVSVEEEKENKYENHLIGDASLEEALAVAAALTDDTYFNMSMMSSKESNAPMQRFSTSRKSRKFSDMLSAVALDTSGNIATNETEEEFDEFDNLLYQATNMETKDLKKPSGLEQLLTAEIRTDPLKPTQEKDEQEEDDIYESREVEVRPFQEVHVNGITYLVRDSLTPEPIYEDWNIVELHKKLHEFGIKPLKSYQAIKMLKYIYRSTHPIVYADEKTNDANDNGENILRKNDQCNEIKLLEDKEIPNDNDHEENKEMILELSDNCSGDILLKNLHPNWDKLHEGEEYIFQTNITKKTQHPLLPLHKAWSNLVASNSALHERLIMYEPIDLESIYRYFKSLNYCYDLKAIREFFDKRSIIFSYESSTVKKTAGGLQKPRVGRQKKR